jgi:3-oxoacyl-[acyl-carrier protein] reductase
MELKLAGKKALVAGSSRGIGLAIAENLLAEGCLVCITGRDRASLELTEQNLKSRYPVENILSIAGDFTNSKTIRNSLGEIGAAWGFIDLLIANLGSGNGTKGWQQEPAEWDLLFNQNFYGSVRLAQAVIPDMIERRSGGIVFIGSIAGLEMTGAPIAYSSAKAALIHYSKALAQILAEHLIRVNIVAPGNICFPGGRWAQRVADAPHSIESYLNAEVPLKRFGTTNEIAALVTFLCSPLATFSTGSCLVVDGGQTRHI